MKLSEMISELQKIKDEYEDMPVVLASKGMELSPNVKVNSQWEWNNCHIYPLLPNTKRGNIHKEELIKYCKPQLPALCISIHF